MEIDVNVVLKGGSSWATGAHRAILPDQGRDPWRRHRGAPHCDLDGARLRRRGRGRAVRRLRAGTVLADGAHIGNFVETKNAGSAGQQGQPPDLSGRCGHRRRVNIGAGTITCNYDGVNKSPTTIEDGAFIGSNSSLVAR